MIFSWQQQTNREGEKSRFLFLLRVASAYQQPKGNQHDEISLVYGDGARAPRHSS